MSRRGSWRARHRPAHDDAARVDVEGRLIRVDPLIDWTPEDIRAFIRRHKLPLHPRAVLPLRYNGRVVGEEILRAIAGFFVLYLFLFMAAATTMAASEREILWLTPSWRQTDQRLLRRLAMPDQEKRDVKGFRRASASVPGRIPPACCAPRRGG